MGKVLITDTILRDAHQSQAATRMRLEEMLPVADKLDKIGYYSLECWGGATFDSCMRFLNEDPWERLRALRKGDAQHQAANALPRPEHSRLLSIMRTTWWMSSSKSPSRTALTSSASSMR